MKGTGVAAEHAGHVAHTSGVEGTEDPAPSTSPGPGASPRGSPICYIHFAHPFVYLDSPDEIIHHPRRSNSVEEEEESFYSDEDLFEGESEEEEQEEEEGEEKGQRGEDWDSSRLLLDQETLLDGPPKDLLTQLLYSDQSLSTSSEDRASFRTVLDMLRDSWRSRPSSCNTVVRQKSTNNATATTSSRRRLSAPETCIRRYSLLTRSSVEKISVPPPKSAPPRVFGAPTTTTTSTTTLVKTEEQRAVMCTDRDDEESSSLSTINHNSNYCTMQHFDYKSAVTRLDNSCYCRCSSSHLSSYTSQNEYTFSCRVSLEQNLPSQTSNYFLPGNYSNHECYIPKTVPRYSALPRSMSMLANCSSSSSSSSSSDEDCQSLADSLEDTPPNRRRLSHDERPVRGGAPLVPHRTAPKIPVPKGEMFFVPLKDQNTTELRLPPSLREKLERRRQEMENRPKPIERVPAPSRPVRTRRKVIGPKIQRFECIPEESEPRKRPQPRAPLTRTYAPVPRPPRLSQAQRGLQGVVEPITPRGKEALGEDMVASVTTGWVNFYLLRDDSTDTDKSSGRRRKSRRPKAEATPEPKGTATAVRTTDTRTAEMRTTDLRTAEVRTTQTRTVTVVGKRGSQQPRQLNLRSRPNALPKLAPAPSHAGDGQSSSQGTSTLPALASAAPRMSVPLIRIKHPTSESLTSDTGVSLPSLQHLTSTSSSDSPPRSRRSSSTSSPAPRTLSYPSARRRNHQGYAARQSKPSVAPEQAEKSNTWSVTVSGSCPQPEMEVRLMFPPTETSNKAVGAGNTAAVAGVAAGVVQLASQSDSGLGEENNGGGPKQLQQQNAITGTNTARFTLTFKNQQSLDGVVPAQESLDDVSVVPQQQPQSRAIEPASPKRRTNSPRALPAASSKVEPQEALMWPEMQAILQEQVVLKKNPVKGKDSTVVERLRGGEGTEQVEDLSVRGSAIKTRKKKPASSSVVTRS